MGFSSYIIAATPRSGSTLLCDLLSGTGIAGQPHLYYRRVDILDYARKWGVSSPDVIGDEAFERAYLEAVRRTGAAQSGIFGLRLMWPTVAQLSLRLRATHPDRANVVRWRRPWAEMANACPARHGHTARIDHHSHVARGIALEPQNKIGPNAARRARRGEPSERVDEHRAIAQQNAEPTAQGNTA